jgi:hypothetical protein
MAKNLITVSEYKDYKSIKGDSDDSTITSLLPSISELVKNYCGRTFVDYVDTAKTQYDNGGTDCVFLDEYPIISITSVNESSDNHATQQLLVEDQQDIYGIYVDYAEGTIQTVDGSNFTTAFHALEIIYTGGYEEVPEDLKLACFHLVDYFRKEQFTMKKIQGASTVERIESDDLPGHIKRTLDSYRVSF